MAPNRILRDRILEEISDDTVKDDTVNEKQSTSALTNAIHEVRTEALRLEPNESSRYCKPTSSKVLIEDMVMDKDDDLHFQEHHVSETLVETPLKRRFWDRPTIPKYMAWPGDTRMPLEWNMMTSDVRGINLPVGREEWHPHDATANSLGLGAESVGPYEFTRSQYPDKKHREYLQQNIRVGSEFGSEEVIIRMARMCEENECRNNRRSTGSPRHRAGKE